MAVMDRLHREDISDDDALGLLADAAGSGLLEASTEEGDAHEDEGDTEDEGGVRGSRGPLEDQIGALMVAALSGEPVPDLTADDRAMIRRERELHRMSVADAFAALADLEPRVRELANDVESGAWADADLPPAADEMLLSERMDHVRLPLPHSARDKLRSFMESVEARQRFITKRADPLVGPLADNPPDPILRTDTARDAVSRYLRAIGRDGDNASGWNEPMEMPSFGTALANAWKQRRERKGHR
jgi:hypothetical protein